MGRRRRAKTFGRSLGRSRMLSLLMALAVLGILYERFRDPDTWRWMAAEEVRADEAAPLAPNAKEQPKENAFRETVVPGPNDLDEAQKTDFLASARVIEDKRPMQPHETPAYMKLIGWSRTEPMGVQESRARRDVLFTQFWDNPDVYRGQLFRLRLHVNRVLRHEQIPENKHGVKEVFELWGTTDESLAFPYCVLVTELPPGVSIGAKAEAEVVFAGYFLKVLGFQAVENKRGSPMFVGRVRSVGRPPARKAPPMTHTEVATFIGLGLLVAIGFGWFTMRNRRGGRSASPHDRIPEELPAEFPAGMQPSTQAREGS